ncbi:MAG: hypothetical protein N2738_07885 [Thermodesulfovibrionales bacterium]|nr:hypothetical protein [Thermodesulfovibrionales bacterium]
MAEENGSTREEVVKQQEQDLNQTSKREESSNQENKNNNVSSEREPSSPEKHEETTTRASVNFSISLLHKRLETASKGYEEILRIIHSTNQRNPVLVKKNFYEIELICKNALIELKGV